MKRPPSIRDVAAASGVSRATVQRALAGDIHCAAQTRQRIASVAQSLGYRPDPVFAAMGTRRKRGKLHGTPLAFLDSSEAPGGDYFLHAKERASELGYDLRNVTCEDFGGPKFFSVLYAQGFAGLLTGRVKKEWFPILERNEFFPAVSCVNSPALPFHSFRLAAVPGVLCAWRKILDAGFRRIGPAIFRHDPVLEDDYSREAAVLLCQKEFHKPAERIPPLLADHFDSGKFAEWLRTHKPEVVLGFSSGEYFRMTVEGMRIPEDMAFATLHLYDINGFEGRMAGLNPCIREIGFAAINLLDQMVRHGERGIPDLPMVISFKPKWLAGASLPSSLRQSAKTKPNRRAVKTQKAAEQAVPSTD